MLSVHQLKGLPVHGPFESVSQLQALEISNNPSLPVAAASNPKPPGASSIKAAEIPHKSQVIFHMLRNAATGDGDNTFELKYQSRDSYLSDLGKGQCADYKPILKGGKLEDLALIICSPMQSAINTATELGFPSFT